MAKGPFKINSQYVSTYDRQIWLFAKYEIQNTEGKKNHNSKWFLILSLLILLDEIFDTAFSVNVQILGLDTNKLLPLAGEKNRTRHLKCKGKECEEFTILHLGFLEYSHYQFIVTFYGLNNKRYNIEKLTFYVSKKLKY